MPTSALNPRVVRTELDRVVYSIFNPQMKPGFVSVADKRIFNQIPSDKGSEQEEIFAGSGYWEKRGETQNVPLGQSKFGQKVTYTHTEFSRQEEIPKHFFDDAKFNAITNIVKAMMNNGKSTQELNGFAAFRKAFTATTGTLTSDGLSLCNNSHTLLNSSMTVDNYLTAKLGDDTINEMIQKLAEMKGQDGVMSFGTDPEVLLTACYNFKRACELIESELSAETANNAINVYSSKYGIYVAQSKFLGAAAGGSDHYAFLLGKGHQINRYIREAINTWHRTWEETNNRTFVYGGAYRETIGVPDFVGAVGTDGTTGAYA